MLQNQNIQQTEKFVADKQTRRLRLSIGCLVKVVFVLIRIVKVKDKNGKPLKNGTVLS